MFGLGRRVREFTAAGVIVLGVLLTGCSSTGVKGADAVSAGAPEIGAGVPKDVAVALTGEMKQNLDAYKAAEKPESERLKAYRIDRIEAVSGQEAVYKVTYAVQPVVAPVSATGAVQSFWAAASGTVENGWVVGKVKLIKVTKEGDSFRFADGMG